MNFQKKEKIHPKKKDFIRVKNDYIYPNGFFMRLVKIKPIKHEKTPPPKTILFRTIGMKNSIIIKHIHVMSIQISTAASTKL